MQRLSKNSSLFLRSSLNSTPGTYNFLVDNYRAQGVYAYVPPSTDTTPNLLTWAQLMTMAAEIFIVLHEIGHIIAGHLDSSPANAFRLFPSDKPAPAASDIKIYEHDWKAEY